MSSSVLCDIPMETHGKTPFPRTTQLVQWRRNRTDAGQSQNSDAPSREGETEAHTHTHKEGERERGGEIERASMLCNGSKSHNCNNMGSVSGSLVHTEALQHGSGKHLLLSQYSSYGGGGGEEGGAFGVLAQWKHLTSLLIAFFVGQDFLLRYLSL